MFGLPSAHGTVLIFQTLPQVHAQIHAHTFFAYFLGIERIACGRKKNHTRMCIFMRLGSRECTCGNEYEHIGFFNSWKNIFIWYSYQIIVIKYAGIYVSCFVCVSKYGEHRMYMRACFSAHANVLESKFAQPHINARSFIFIWKNRIF